MFVLIIFVKRNEKRVVLSKLLIDVRWYWFFVCLFSRIINK